MMPPLRSFDDVDGRERGQKKTDDLRAMTTLGPRTLLYRTVVVYEKKNRSLVFSGSRKIPTLGSTVQWETRQASFPTGTVGPRVGIFLSPLNTNDGFYLSHIPHNKSLER